MGEVFCIACTVIMIVMIIVIIVVASNMNKSANNATKSYEQLSAQIQKENDKLEQMLAENDEDEDEDEDDDDDEEE